MKKYIKNSRYNSELSSSSKFEGFDRQKYYKLYADLLYTILDGMNADLPNNIKEAFKMLGGKVYVCVENDNYISYDGRIGDNYTIGGAIMLSSLQGDAERLAEDLTMAEFKTTEGKDVGCNTYEFIDWVLSI